MTAQAKTILENAIQLSPVQRAELVEQILASFNFPSRSEIDELWAAEAEERIDAFDQGLIKSTPAHQVFEDINQATR